MSTNGKPPDQESTTNGTSAPRLDVAKLHSLPTEHQDLTLLTYVSELQQYAKDLPSDSVPAHQAEIKREIIKIVGLSTPVPSRVIRQTLGRILADVFNRGSSQLLHETVNDLLLIVNAGKGEKDLSNKHVATTCLGLLFREAGNRAVSLAAIVSSSLLKLVKVATNHAGLQASAIRALGQLSTGLASSIDEQIARDIWKSARSMASGEKSLVVQREACLCLKALVQETSYFLNVNDFESLKSTIWKVLESSSVAVRHSGSLTLARFLVRTYSEHGSSEVVPIVRKPKKTKKSEPGADQEEEEDRPSAPTPSKASTQLSLSLQESLKVFAGQYCRASVSNRARAGLATGYKLLLEGLPGKIVQDHYAVLADHLFTEVLDHPTITNHRYRSLLTRKFVHHLLSDIVATKLLPENGQIQAARWLINDVLKNYPKVIQDRREPSKRVLTAALTTLAHLLSRLGPASSTLQDSCREAIFQCLQHPSYTVQVHSAYCFRIFVQACPQQVARCLDEALSHIKKDLTSSAETRSQRRAIGYSMSIAAMLSTARDSPLHSSVELFSRCFTFATELLKNSASLELRLCATQVQVAWTIFGGLMTLGPSFVKVHLNQLLLLWRNASPPPLTQDNSSKRGQLELSFLAHVRECALTALHLFLQHNGSLITSDGSKRLLVVLHNSVLYLNSLPNVKQTDDIANRLVPAVQLQDFAVMLRRRVLQCMSRLMSLKNVDYSEVSSQSDVIGLTLQTFMFPERPSQKNLEAALASSASTFEGIWELGDNWGYGLNSLLHGYEIQLPSTGPVQVVGSPSIMEGIENALSNAASIPALPALEHDSALVCGYDVDREMATLVSPFTACITAAIQLFAISFPQQSERVQESCVEQLATALAQPMQREPGRKAAMQLNTVTALLSALAVANRETAFPAGKLASQRISRIAAELLISVLSDPDDIVRNAAAQAFGRLCNLGGSQITAAGIKQLIDTIVTNRDPNARAGCALALGQVHAQVGAMAATNHLKNIVGVLLSLCSDSHPVVHFWALKGLAAVAESSGLTFSGYTNNSLGMLARVYSNDSHNEESASAASSNVELEHYTPLAIGECIDSIVNVLGPDLQDVGKSRNLILTLIAFFRDEESIPLQVQSYICLGHVSLYAPAHVQLTAYVHDLQIALTSENALLEKVAVSGLENLMKRSASEVLRVSKSGLDDALWTRLDKSLVPDSLQSILRTWMQQTCLQETVEWVSRCQNVLSRTRMRKETATPAKVLKSAAPDLADEEVAGLSSAVAMGSADGPSPSAEGQEYLRWQTRGFAMQLLSELLEIVQVETLPDQIIPAEAMLQKKVADIVRVAFSASTANVVSLRLWGLHILDQVLKLFGKTPDPDFLEASLLEQYQAQISSALTPAFAADSTPELAAAAIAVCATFVGTGIVTNAERMGRIFKVLSFGVENLTQPTPEPNIGDLKNLTLNAQSMLKMALLSGWAQLQLASGEQSYLEDIVHPYVSKLAPLWLSSLQEFAALRFEPEISDTLGGDYATNSVQERYGSFDREIRLRFYQSSWLSIVDAIAVLVEKDSDAIFDALDNKKVTSIGNDEKVTEVNGKDMSFREEPVAFFFILFGLAYEALVTQARDSPAQALAILNALKKILTPAVSGSAIYQDIVFTETTDTLDRLALTSNSETQAVLVEIARNLSIDHIVAKTQERDDKLSDDIDQLFELTRIIILVLVGLVPTLEDPPGITHRGLTDASVTLVQSCCQALVDVSGVFPSIIRGDLHACIIHCYCTMLATGICQDDVIPRTVPILRSFLQNLSKNSRDESTARLVKGGLSRMLSTLTIAQRRENDYSMICAKNTLLSITVLLSTAGRLIPSNEPLVRKAVTELLDCLQDVGLAKMAASCIRTLLMTNPKSACDENIARMLWPSLLAFINDSTAEDPEAVKSTLMQALTASVIFIRGDGRYAAMSILIPSLLLHAERQVTNDSRDDPSKDSASRLLELAAADAKAFRATVALLGDDQRSLLETLLRSAGVGNRQSTQSNESEEESRPAIALRMDF